MFFTQLQTFEDLLKSEKLKPFEQMKVRTTTHSLQLLKNSFEWPPHIQTNALLQGLSQLAEGLNSLERGYLLARDEHKLLQQRGAEISHFDPER